MITNANRTILNRSGGKATKTQLGTLIDKSVNCIVVTYDFAVNGGAVGDITLKAKALPADAVILRVFHDEITDVTSGGAATVTLKAGSTALTGAIAKATFSGVKSEALASSATAIKISALSDLVITVATAALTAGKVRFIIEYVVSKDTL